MNRTVLSCFYSDPFYLSATTLLRASIRRISGDGLIILGGMTRVRQQCAPVGDRLAMLNVFDGLRLLQVMIDGIATRDVQ